MLDLSPKPNLGGKIVRFLFGAIFGFFMSFSILVDMPFENSYTIALVVIAMTILFGVISLKIGDKLWDSVKDWTP